MSTAPKQRDWADDLAKTIISDLLDFRRDPSDLIAERLRLLRTQGERAGLQAAQQLISGKPT